MVAAALGMADAAETQKGAFVAGGFAADFAEQLRQVARELGRRRRSTIGPRTSGAATRRTAGRAGEEITKGRAIIALLDAMIAPVLEATPSLLTESAHAQQQVRPEPVPP